MAIFKSFLRYKRAVNEARYIALIAGFMAFTPFPQTDIHNITSAFTIKDESYPLAYESTTTLMARQGISPYNARPKKSPSNIYKRFITAYSSTPDETDSTPFITASGSYVHFGVVAANWLPIGTAIRIPKYFGKQVFIVEDRMHSRNSQKLDVWLPSKEAAIKFGSHLAEIEVL